MYAATQPAGLGFPWAQIVQAGLQYKTARSSQKLQADIARRQLEIEEKYARIAAEERAATQAAGFGTMARYVPFLAVAGVLIFMLARR